VWLLVRFGGYAQKRGKLREMGIYSGRIKAGDLRYMSEHAVTKFRGRRLRSHVSAGKPVAAMGVFGAMLCA
jgi:inner membrane protein involved in colicin E2 resistance